MRKATYIILTLFLLLIFVGVFAFINQDKLVERFIRSQSAAVDYRYELLEKDDKIRLVTVGTSSPLPGARIRSCNAVFVNGKFFVFDAGPGASRGIEHMKLPINKLDAIFITHWHADHYMDLPELNNRSWLLNRDKYLDVYGPEPLDSILKGMAMFLEPENRFRLDHHGSEIINLDWALPRGHQIDLDASGFQEVYNHDGVVVEAFAVNHDPITPSFGYRIRFKDKSLVISGDTSKSDEVIKYSKGADILLHESLAFDLIRRVIKIQEESGNLRNTKILTDILDYHTSTIEAAEIAKAAGVKKLILTHLGPAPENPISRRFYTSGMDRIYDGPILLAVDGDLFVIE